MIKNNDKELALERNEYKDKKMVCQEKSSKANCNPLGTPDGLRISIERMRKLDQDGLRYTEKKVVSGRVHTGIQPLSRGFRKNACKTLQEFCMLC